MPYEWGRPARRYSEPQFLNERVVALGWYDEPAPPPVPANVVPGRLRPRKELKNKPIFCVHGLRKDFVPWRPGQRPSQRSASAEIRARPRPAPIAPQRRAVSVDAGRSRQRIAAAPPRPYVSRERKRPPTLDQNARRWKPGQPLIHPPTPIRVVPKPRRDYPRVNPGQRSTSRSANRARPPQEATRANRPTSTQSARVCRPQPADPPLPRRGSRQNPHPKAETPPPYPDWVPTLEPVIEEEEESLGDVVLNDNFASDQAVITPVIQESVERALRARLMDTPGGSQERNCVEQQQCPPVQAEILATYEVPVEGSPDEVVQEALAGQIEQGPVQIQLVLTTPEGEQREVEIDVQRPVYCGPENRPRRRSKYIPSDWNVNPRLSKIPILPGSNLCETIGRLGTRRITIRIPIEIQETDDIPEGRVFYPKSILRKRSKYVGRSKRTWSSNNAPKPPVNRPPPRTSSCGRDAKANQSQERRWR